MHAYFLWGGTSRTSCISKTIDPTDINLKPGVLTEINIFQRENKMNRKKLHKHADRHALSRRASAVQKT
jgi:hypothetical protein